MRDEEKTKEQLTDELSELRRLMEETLQERDHLYRESVENTPNPLFSIDREGAIQIWNRACEEFFQYAAFEIIGRSYHKLLWNAEDISVMEEILSKVWKGGSAVNIDMTYQCKDGTIRHTISRVFPIRSSERDIRTCMFANTDVTERNRAEKALQESEKRYRELADLLPQPIFEIDLNGAVTFVNRNAFDTFGYTPHDLEKEYNIFQIIAPEDQKRAQENFQRRLRGDDVGISQYTAVRKDGNEFPVIVHASPIIREDKPIGIIGLIVDFTELKKAEDAIKESERKYRILFESSLTGTYVTGLNGETLAANNVGALVLGYDRPEELVGRNVLNFYKNPQDRAMVYDKIKRGDTTQYELDYIKKDGSETIALISTSIIEYEGTQAALTSAVDITERKKAEKELASRLRYEEGLANCSRSLLNDNQDALQEVLSHLLEASGVSRVYIFENFEDSVNCLSTRQTYEVSGPGVKPEINNPVLQNFPYKKGFSRWQKELSQGKPIAGPINSFPETERVILQPQDILSILVLPIEVEGRWYGFVGFDDTQKVREWNKHDIRLLQTASEMIGTYLGRKKAKRRLLEEKVFSEATLNSMPGIFYVFDQQGKLIRWNKSAQRVIEYSDEEMLDVKVFDVFEMSHRVEVKREAAKVYTEGGATAEAVILSKSGKRTPLFLKGVRAEIEDETYLVGVGIDITEQKKAEDALRESEDRYRILTENSPDAILSLDEEGRVQFMNTATKTISGYSSDEILGKRFHEIGILPQKSHAKVQEELDLTWREGIRPLFEISITRKDGNEVPLEAHHQLITGHGRKSLVLVILRDISERKHLEDRLRQAQKMEAIGTLAGSVAHDFNNLLTGIMGNASLILSKLEPDHPHFEMLRSIEHYSQSGADLTQQLLGFARGGKFEVKIGDMNDLLRRSSQMFGRAKKEITVHRKLSAVLWPVEMDETQIEQVFLNLFVNSWHAMPGGGDLYIQTENVAIDEDFAQSCNVTSGNYVKVSVTDTGVGMDETTRQRIFEPFFTTREMGRGTGLGLASAYGIIKNHDGIINVKSQEGVGTSFEIYLPAFKDEMCEEEESFGQILEGRGETLLLVDDEGVIMDVGVVMLKALGYQVLTAWNGEEAIEIYRNRQDEIDLVMLDLIMPRMGGELIYDSLKAINPDVKVILTSGYGANDRVKEILKHDYAGFIQKPFTMETLARTIREII
ncbi:MAG: PAS domain S-box protein [Thermodesulfobacteriota bacterium]|nr:PAS domain S-box protein [Thermodesulfobacteriota bacterium]